MEYSFSFYGYITISMFQTKISNIAVAQLVIWQNLMVNMMQYDWNIIMDVVRL